MRRRTYLPMALVFMLAVSALNLIGQSSTIPAQTSKVAADYGKLPLSFEANRGQTDSRVRYLSRGSGYSLFLTDSEAVLSFGKVGKSSPGQASSRPFVASGGNANDVLRMQLQGANTRSHIEGLEDLPGTVNYFIGEDRANWRTSVPTYARVKYDGVYPGVDLVYYGNQRQLEYDFEVAPGADPNEIRMRLAGAKSLRVDGSGNLLIGVGNRQIVFNKPFVYQNEAEGRRAVEGSFKLLKNKQVSFNIGQYDRNRMLVIDPVLAYSTFLSGNGSNQDIGSLGRAIAVDSSENAYITGVTSLLNFPTTSGSYQPSLAGNQFNEGLSYPFIAKLNATGTAVVYTTYLAGGVVGADGGYGDVASSIFVDGAGDAYVTGWAFSSDFPVTENAFQSAKNSTYYEYNSNCFITKLNPTGTGLLYSTYLGGSSSDACVQVTVNSTGNAFVIGTAESNNFPVTPGAFMTGEPNYDQAFVTEFNPQGSGLVYSTYLGGTTNASYAHGIAVDSTGNAYVTGQTYATDFPDTAKGYQSVNYATVARGLPTGFVAKLKPTGSALAFATYLGGSGTEYGRYGDDPAAIAVDSYGNAYISGMTDSQDFPVTSGALQNLNLTYASGNYPETYTTGFVTKLNSTGSSLIFSTYVGSSAGEYTVPPRIYSTYNQGIAGSGSMKLDSSGNVYFTGATFGIDYPVTSNAIQSANNSSRSEYNGLSPYSTDAFVTELSSSGALVYSTYLGGSGADYSGSVGDYGSSLALDSTGSIYVTGIAASYDFPATSGAYQTTKTTDYAAFVSKINPGGSSNNTLTTLVSSNNPQQPTQQLTFTSFVRPVSPSAGIPTGSVSFSFNGGSGAEVALDATGHASYPTTALSSGIYTVTATYSGDSTFAASSNTMTEAIAGAPASIAVVSGNKQTGAVNLPLPEPIVVVVKDANGTPVPGVQVNFGGQDLSYTSIQRYTNANGEFAVEVTPTSYNGTNPVVSGTASVNDGNTLTFLSVTVTPPPTVAPPVFLIAPGSYCSTQTLTITDVTPGAQIYYTTNGGIPSQYSSTLYTHPITIAESETIEAMAFATDYNASPLVRGSYGIGQPQTLTFSLASMEPFGPNPIKLSATASSELPVAFKIISGKGSINGDLLTPSALGPITVSASQGGSSTFCQATPVQRTTEVIRAEQSIAFPKPKSPVTYGATAISLPAKTNAGLPITYTVTGPGKLKGYDLHITGVGTIKVTASQGGDTNYYPAKSVEATIEVIKAKLTAEAANLSMKEGTSPPKLTYKLVGLVNGDTQATAITGTPKLTTTATSKSVPGGYPITITVGTLAAKNYTLSFKSGTMTVTK